jgi:pimeloyl-ACP methyl ester carboxylesterase
MFGRRPKPLPPDPVGFEPFGVTTLDDIPIAGVCVKCPGSSTAVVLCHGFLGSWRRTQNIELARILAERCAVFLLDFRGHGASKGLSTVGDREAMDVHAVVQLARARGFDRVVTVGASMGAVSVLREAARFHDVDAVVSISSPGRWSGHGRVARIAGVLVTTGPGRAFARRVFKTMVYPEWTWSPPPVEMVEHITAPILIVHGTNDRFIPKAQAQLLFARANPPKRLMIIAGFGHAELGYSREFGVTLRDEIDEMLAGEAWGIAATVPRPSGSAAR